MQENFFFFCSEGWQKFYTLTIVILNCNILLHSLFICAIVLGITNKTIFFCVLKSLVINESAVMSMICNSKTHRTSYQSCAKVKVDPKHGSHSVSRTQTCSSGFQTNRNVQVVFPHTRRLCWVIRFTNTNQQLLYTYCKVKRINSPKNKNAVYLVSLMAFQICILLLFFSSVEHKRRHFGESSLSLFMQRQFIDRSLSSFKNKRTKKWVY